MPKKSEEKKAPAVRRYLVSRFKDHARTRKIIAIKSHPDQDEVEVQFEGVSIRLNSSEAKAVKVAELLQEAVNAKPE